MKKLIIGTRIYGGTEEIAAGPSKTKAEAEEELKIVGWSNREKFHIRFIGEYWYVTEETDD